MKRTFRALAVLTLLVASFSSCKKDSNSAAGSFTYDSKAYNTNAGQYITTSGSNYSNLVLSSTSITTSANFNGTISYVDFMFDNSAITEGTYTYKQDTDEGYDAKKNFFDGQAAINLVVANGSITGGTLLGDVSEGTVTITKSGSSYSITYSLTFADGKTSITGKYNGSIETVTNQPD